MIECSANFKLEMLRKKEIPTTTACSLPFDGVKVLSFRISGSLR